MPNMNIIMKNNTAHSCGNGMRSTASGYAINASPGPCVTTSWISTPIECAMKPKMAKIEKPAKTAVKALVIETATASKWELLLKLLNDASVMRDPQPIPVGKYFYFERKREIKKNYRMSKKLARLSLPTRPVARVCSSLV